MKKLSLSLIMLLACSSAYAGSTYCTNCSTVFTQSLDRVTNVSQLTTMMSQLDNDISQTASQITMVQQNIERYQNMQQNTKSLDASSLSKMQGEYKKLASLLSQLNTYKSEADAAGRKYQELYPQQKAVGSMTQQEYRQNWDAWAAENNRASQATYQLSAKQLGELQDAEEFDVRVNDLLKTPQGRMEAAQAGNQLSAMTLQEVRSMRALMATQAQQEAQASSMQQKEKEAQEEHMRQLLKKSGEMGNASTPAQF